jgi:hypothetical protein
VKQGLKSDWGLKKSTSPTNIDGGVFFFCDGGVSIKITRRVVRRAKLRVEKIAVIIIKPPSACAPTAYFRGDDRSFTYADCLATSPRFNSQVVEGLYRTRQSQISFHNPQQISRELLLWKAICLRCANPSRWFCEGSSSSARLLCRCVCHSNRVCGQDLRIGRRPLVWPVVEARWRPARNEVSPENAGQGCYDGDFRRTK